MLYHVRKNYFLPEHPKKMNKHVATQSLPNHTQHTIGSTFLYHFDAGRMLKKCGHIPHQLAKQFHMPKQWNQKVQLRRPFYVQKAEQES